MKSLRKPKVGGTIAAIALIVAGIVMFSSGQDEPDLGPDMSMLWFYDLNTNEPFGVPRGDGREVGPQPAPSGPLENASEPLLKVGDPAGVRMYKFACGDCSKEQFIGYFNTWPATVREKLVSDLLDGSEVQHLEGVMDPGEKRWHPITSERGQEIVTAHRRRCGTVKPVRCEVNNK